MIRRSLLALFVAANVAGAVDAPGLDAPLKSPTAKRLRGKAQGKWEEANAVFARQRTGKEEEQPSTEELRKAVALVVEAIGGFEAAQMQEWDTTTNALQAQAVRAWAEMQAMLPPVEPPKDPEALAKWKKAQLRAVSERKRDARRRLGKILGGRRHAKLFSRCGRCDGRGEFVDRFGGQPGQKPQKRTCKTCQGNKLVSNRKRILLSHWFCYSPLYRSDGRNRADMSYVLRLGVRGENRLAPFIMSTRIASKVEDHGWWVSLQVVEKVHEDPHSRKGVEQTTDYVMMKIGKLWWVYSDRFDGRKLLKLPTEDAE